MSANQRDPTNGHTVPRTSVSTFTATAPAPTPSYTPYAASKPDNKNPAVPSEAPSGTPTFGGTSRDTPRDDGWDDDLESGSPKATGYSGYFSWSMGRFSGPVSNQKYGEPLASRQSSSQKHSSRGAQPDAYVDVEAWGGADQAPTAPSIWSRMGSSFDSARATAQDMYASSIGSRTPKTQKGPPRNSGEIV